MMSQDEHLARENSSEGWSPGWFAIDEAFNQVYPRVEPPHLATHLHQRAMLGRRENLDDCSLYPSPHGCQHLVSYGMSNLCAAPDQFGQVRRSARNEQLHNSPTSSGSRILWIRRTKATTALHLRNSCSHESSCAYLSRSPSQSISRDNF